MPNPLTSPIFASGTCRPDASAVSWRIASTMPRKPPAAPACPAESWPPLVLSGKSPSQVKRCSRTKDGPSCDIDFVQAYDDYPVITLLQLEDLGFCGKGEGPSLPLAAEAEILELQQRDD